MKLLNKLLLIGVQSFFMVSMLAGTQSMNVVFDGTDHENWSTGNNSTFEVKDGHLICQMGLNGSKYRGDLQFNSTAVESADIMFNPGADRFLAVKFIGSRPNGNLKMEFNDGVGWFNSKWNGGNPASVITSGGNTIYYFDLLADEKYSDEIISVKKLNFIIADATNEPFEYTIDWVATFLSVSDIEGYKDVKDDGEGDEDDGVIVIPAVSNKRTNTGYTTLNEAVGSADNGDTLFINQDISISKRIEIGQKEITIQANETDVVVELDFDGIALLAHGVDSRLIIGGTDKNIIIDGKKETFTSTVVEGNLGSIELLRGVVFKDCMSTNKYGSSVCIKNSASLKLDGVKFENCRTLDVDGSDLGEAGLIFVGSNEVLLSGNNIFSNSTNAISIENEYYLTAEAVDNLSPIGIYLTNTDRTNVEVVKGCDDASKFVLTNHGYLLESGNGNLEIARDLNNGLVLMSSNRKVYSKDHILYVVAERVEILYIVSLEGRIIRTLYLHEGENEITCLSEGVYIVGGEKVII